MKFGFKIKAKGKKKAEVLIYEDIGDSMFGGMSAKRFADELKEHGPLDEINVRINSFGGSVFDGVAIYNTLRSSGAKIIVDVDGVAASIASIIAMAGDVRRTASNSMWMIHDPWIFTAGTADELRKQAELLDSVRGTLLETYVSRSGADEKTVSDMMKEETWLTADKVKELGFVTEITGELAVAASGNSEIRGHYKYVPECLGKLVAASAPAPVAADPFVPQPNNNVISMRARVAARKNL